MRKTLKRQALEKIVCFMDGIVSDYQNGFAGEIKDETTAMKNLAEAFTLVKRGVMLPDYGREKYE